MRTRSPRAPVKWPPASVPGSVQILDLGVSDATTYLITNHTSAADLLDLVVASSPPYVEPFFTDTLGSEIFGQARSHEPETYDDDEEVDAGYINYGDNQPRQSDQYRAAVPSPAAGRAPAGTAEHGAGAQAPTAPVRKAPVVPPLPPARRPPALLPAPVRLEPLRAWPVRPLPGRAGSSRVRRDHRSAARPARERGTGAAAARGSLPERAVRLTRQRRSGNGPGRPQGVAVVRGRLRLRPGEPVRRRRRTARN